MIVIIPEDDGGEEEGLPGDLITETILVGRKIDHIRMEGLNSLGTCLKACSGWSTSKVTERYRKFVF